MEIKARYFDDWDWCKARCCPIAYQDEDGKEYCVFHAPEGKKGLSQDEFNGIVYEEIDRAMDEGVPCDLSGTVFDGDISFERYNEDKPLPPINFEEARFGGNVDFRGVVFSGDAHFDGVLFCGEALFSGAEFQGKAYFFDTAFRERVDFSTVTFAKELYFSWGSFQKGAVFTGAVFESKTIFKRPAFEEKRPDQ